MIAPLEMSIIGRQIVDLLCLAIRGDERALSSDTSAVYAGHLARIERFIRQNVSNTALPPHLIAAYSKMSIGYLHRLFRSTGQTVGQYILHQRLISAEALLCERPDLRLMEIAYRLALAIRRYFLDSSRTNLALAPPIPTESRASGTVCDDGESSGP
jgi:AraC-like DNA-binding protein